MDFSHETFNPSPTYSEESVLMWVVTYRAVYCNHVTYSNLILACTGTWFTNVPLRMIARPPVGCAAASRSRLTHASALQKLKFNGQFD